MVNLKISFCEKKLIDSLSFNTIQLYLYLKIYLIEFNIFQHHELLFTPFTANLELEFNLLYRTLVSVRYGAH